MYFASMDFEDAQRNILFGAMYLAQMTFSLTLCLIAAQRDIRFIELSGPLMCGSGCLVMAICNFSDIIEMNDLFNN